MGILVVIIGDIGLSPESPSPPTATSSSWLSAHGCFGWTVGEAPLPHAIVIAAARTDIPNWYFSAFSAQPADSTPSPVLVVSSEHNLTSS